ncbi:hypothetical protein FNV43_RR14992 [Rhamnella rubrinervis]|uniref:Uncharacterized protein n=1 Tax=Rhamnella rubrinervis TaxID=2594499 RepID=A0A8K0MGU6_9ROSA|nr:hypothetical protein FNV43_RR14992 [Rhamnella rubrinervis]
MTYRWDDTLVVPTTRPSHTDGAHHYAVGVPMESKSTVIIIVFYDDTWFKDDNDCYQFKDYQSKVSEIPKNYTYSQLTDEFIPRMKETMIHMVHFTREAEALKYQLLVLPHKLEKGKEKENMLMYPMSKKLNCGKIKDLKVLFWKLKMYGKLNYGKVKYLKVLFGKLKMRGKI